MPAKQPKPSSVEQRITKREVLVQQPKGMLQLHAENRCLDVYRIRDISPFGVCLHLKDVVDKGAQIQLTYICNDIQIEVLGVVVWGKVVKSPYPNPLDAPGWWVGISLHPNSTGANFALYQAILENQNSGLFDESGSALYG